MDSREMEREVIKLCAKKSWDMKPLDDLGLLTEEVGELAREVRRMENGRQRPDEEEPNPDDIREHMAEEIGDILFPLIKIAAYYNITLEKAFKNHLDKMAKRYSEVETELVPVKRSPNSGIITSAKKDLGEDNTETDFYSETSVKNYVILIEKKMQVREENLALGLFREYDIRHFYNMIKKLHGILAKDVSVEDIANPFLMEERNRVAEYESNGYTFDKTLRNISLKDALFLANWVNILLKSVRSAYHLVEPKVGDTRTFDNSSEGLIVRGDEE
jgi:NTP pyrophosphatase (non-canonical NTP hydrolase)